MNPDEPSDMNDLLPPRAPPMDVPTNVDAVLPPRADPPTLSAESTNPTPYKRRRMLWQYSLRALLAAQVLIALAIGTLTYYVQRFRMQSEVVSNFDRAHCTFSYDRAEPTSFWSRVAPLFRVEPVNVYSADICDRPLTLEDADLIARLPYLRDLRMARGVTEPAVFDRLATSKTLERLTLIDAERIHLNDEKVAHVGRLQNLRYLSIASTNVGDRGIASLASLPKLMTLDLQWTPVTIRGLRPWINRNSLSELRVPSVLQDEDFDELVQFTSLRDLQLTQVSSYGARRIESLPNLGMLTLNGHVCAEGYQAMEKVRVRREIHLNRKEVK